MRFLIGCEVGGREFGCEYGCMHGLTKYSGDVTGCI